MGTIALRLGADWSILGRLAKRAQFPAGNYSYHIENMAVTIEDVRVVATLARLQFDPQEEERLTLELNRILDYMARLNELDTEDVEPTSHVVPITNAFRADEVVEFPDPEAIVALAPQRQESYYRVPKVIE
jgi:aspartyl-tRNA(Asn)/glutamyl-tRNA(Gln) amidotransferase subunit C